MKKLTTLLSAFAVCGTLFLASCAKEEEPDPTDPTSSDPRAKFNGTWAVSENSQQFGTSTYNVTVTDSSNTTHILIGYLYGFNKKTYATVSGNSISIPTQLIQGTNVSGGGTLANSTQLNLTYYVNSGSTVDTVTAVLTK